MQQGKHTRVREHRDKGRNMKLEEINASRRGNTCKRRKLQERENARLESKRDKGTEGHKMGK